MLNIYLQNEPMTSTIAAPVEQKRPHEMLQTPWIILYFVRIRPISQKFNSSVTYGPTDGRTVGRTDGRTDGRTHPLIEMRERI